MENSKKQTAVEWLEQEIFRKYKFTFQQLNCQPLEEAIEQAKEMEKQQIIDALKAGVNFEIDYGNSTKINYNKYSEQYYTETFNK